MNENMDKVYKWLYIGSVFTVLGVLFTVLGIIL